MKVRIKRIDVSLPLPRYETAGAVGFDFISREETVIAPRSIGMVPGNVVVEVPRGYVLFVTLRSSAPRKKGLLMPHGVGVIDNDYCGPHDEIKIQVYNFLDQPVAIARGERVAQGILVHVDTCDWKEVSDLYNTSRAGFGSTG